MNISINSNYYAAQNLKLRQAATNPNSVPNDNEENIAFKGVMPGRDKLVKTLAGLSVAALGLLGISSKKNADEILETPLEEDLTSKIKKAKKEDPEFFTELKGQVHYVGRDQDIEVPNFSDETIYVLSQYKKQDPEFAYKLAKFAECKYGRDKIDIDQTEYLAKNLKENPELVKKLSYSGKPSDTLEMLKLHEEHPVEVEGLVQINNFSRGENDKFQPKDIEILIDSYKLDPESCKSLAAWRKPQAKSRSVFDASQIATLTPQYKDNKEIIKKLESELVFESFYDLGYAITLLFDKYKEAPEAVNYFIKNQLIYLSKINQAVDLYLQPSGAKYFEILNNDKAIRNIKSSDGRMKFVEESIKNDKFLTDLETKIPAISKELNEVGISILNRLSDDDKKNVDRVIADGRIPKVSIIKGIYNLLPVYAKFPDKPVTDEMIERFNDPLARAFNF